MPPTQGREPLSSDILDLPIHFLGTRVPRESIFQAKQALFITDLLMPRTAEPATNKRILAIGSKPDWICDYYLVAINATQIEWMTALRWVLGDEDAPGATTVSQMMQDAMPGAREISEAELESERRFRAYVEGTD